VTPSNPHVVQFAASPTIDERVTVGGIFELADQMPDANFVIEPCFIRGQMTTLTARPGAGKSTVCFSICMHYCLELALGVLAPQASGLCYYVSVEDLHGTKLRAQAERARMKLPSTQRAIVDSRLRWVHVVESMTPALIADAILRDAGDEAIDLLFVDTGVALFTGDDENGNTQLQAFATECRKHFSTLPGNPCIVLMWHPVKGASADNLQPRGASSFIGTIDANLTLWRDDDRITLGYTKLRGPHFDPIEFVLELVSLELDNGKVWDVPVARPIAGEKLEERHDAGRVKREAILVAMDSPGETLPLRRIAEIALGSADKASTARRHLIDLARVRPALVEQDPLSGDRYVLTSLGKRRAGRIRAQQSDAYRVASGGA